MPKVLFSGQEIECPPNANLRSVLLAAQLPLYNGVARAIHCRGLGTCGTCAVKITGDVSGMTAVERWRLNFPPHKLFDGLRLACQCKILGDVSIEKFDGLWGQKVPREENR